MVSITKFGKWSSSESVYGNFDGGFPLAVFDSDMKNAIVLSPLNSFMAATQASFVGNKTNESMLTFGPLSSIDSVIH